jgi:hypothetical protein
MASCSQAGNDPDDHFRRVAKMVQVGSGTEITTSDLINTMPSYVNLSGDHMATNESRNYSKFSQIARNLKSHKVSKSNFIYQGYADDVRGGFKIADKGMEFVWG